MSHDNDYAEFGETKRLNMIVKDKYQRKKKPFN